MSDYSGPPRGSGNSDFSVDYPSTLPLPPGVYSLLPLVDVVDNFQLPTAPIVGTTKTWSLDGCKNRLLDYEKSHPRLSAHAKDSSHVVGLEGSALDSDDEDEHLTAPAAGGGGGSGGAPIDLKDEFLVPFFLSLPAPPPSSPAPGGTDSPVIPTSVSRRSSSSSSRAYSMTPMTPIPSLRASSPTHSPSPSPHPTQASLTQSQKLEQSSPVGFLRPQILQALYDDNVSMAKMHSRPIWQFYPHVVLPEVAPTPNTGRRSRRGSSYAGTPDGINARSRRGSSFTSTPTGEGGPFKMSEVIKGLDGIGKEKGLKGTVESPKVQLGRVYAVSFAAWVGEEGDKKEVRKEHMDRLTRGWKMKGLFPECLNGWRDEQYSVYGPAPPLSSNSILAKKLRTLAASGPNSKPASRRSKTETPPEDEGLEGEEENENPLPGANLAFTMERAACALFGFSTFGVHLTAYVEEEGKPLRIWVPRRSPTKETWPSYLDNSVAGGICDSQTPFVSIIRECAEEASLSPSFVSSRIKAAGLVSYTYRTPQGWLQPEVEWCYDLRCDAPGKEDEDGTQPKPNVEDGEVESFELLDVEEVVRYLCEGEFKPNCALVLIDFFIRHGLLTHESDVRFAEIVTRMKTAAVLPGPA